MTDEEKLKELDPKNPFTKAIKDWAGTTDKDKEKYYQQNAGVIERWQAEADALAEEDEENKG